MENKTMDKGSMIIEMSMVEHGQIQLQDFLMGSDGDQVDKDITFNETPARDETEREEVDEGDKL